MRFVNIIFLLALAQNVIAQHEITLQDIFVKNAFKAAAVYGFRSSADGNSYTEINDKKELVRFNFATGKQEKIVANFASLQYNGKAVSVDDYQISADEKYILLKEEGKNIYRRSVQYTTYLLELASGKLTKVAAQKLLHANFSPDGKKLAYVYGNNLYMYTIDTGKEKAITTDGKWNSIINGNCDWVYEEEFGFTQAYEWSPNSSYIAFYKFDESAVKEFNYAEYGELYPKDIRYKYPKAGEDNSKVNIFCYDVIKGKTEKIDFTKATDYYVPRIKWQPTSERLFVFELNRMQNALSIFGYAPATKKLGKFYTETNAKYIEINDDFICSKQAPVIFYTSEKSGYRHIYKFNYECNQEVALTKGSYDVQSITACNDETQTVFFTSAKAASTESNLYSVSYSGGESTLLTPEQGVHKIDASSNGNYFLDAYSKLNFPVVYTIRNCKGEILRTLQDNAALKEKIKNNNCSPQQIIQVPNETGQMLNAWVMMPANFDSAKKYPLLMFQYSGPGSQQVSNSYIGRDYWWYQMLSQKGYMIACVDGRGTGNRGEEFKKCTYKQLGKYESDDQIAAAKYFGSLKFVDKNRIGIWGWSYGGFMSSICICKGADVFKSAIAVAPVTNWRYYDNIYTERFMQKPQDNATGYDDNSPINMVKQLKGNYLLIHGSADDNVHYQNSMDMINALIKEGKEFDSEIYPNRAHGISGGNSRYHLYNRLTRFVLEKL